MTDATWTSPLHWERFKSIDDEFLKRYHAKGVKPKPASDNVRLKILLYAGREASAAVRVACSRYESTLARVAEQAMLYEPFTYFDWCSFDEGIGNPLDESEENSIISLEREKADVEKRKRRLLWERERAFKANGQWDKYPSPKERWEGFKRMIEERPSNAKFVKKIALANWMTRQDMQW